MTRKSTKSSECLAQSIADVIEQSCRVWTAQDYRGLHDLWDPNEAEPWIMAEDADAPLVGWAAIEAYWQTSLGLVERDALRYTHLQAKPLGKELVIAIYVLCFVRKAVGPQQNAESEIRLTAIFRKYNETWRFIHLAETPLPSFVTMQRKFDADEGGADARTIS